MVDYSKWDKLVISDSESDSDSENEERASRGGNPFSSFGPGMGGEPQYHSVFSTDPQNFQPVKTEHSWGNCQYGPWGLPDEDPMAVMQRRMVDQFNSRPPTIAFVEGLIKRKWEQIERNKAVSEGFYKRDYIMKISMPVITPEIWRSFRVSGNMSFAAFQDKVVTPLMGYVRNYHAYYFMDHKDGAMIGPVNSQSIDVMHIPLNGYRYMDDTKVKIGDIFQAEGDEMTYLYDLGDHWVHTISTTRILPESESDGKCVCLGGAMHGPPEDCKGNEHYKEMMETFDKGHDDPRNRKQFHDVMHELSCAINFSDELKKNPFYNPRHFSVKETNKRMKQAFASKASVPEGAKMFGMSGDSLRAMGLNWPQGSGSSSSNGKGGADTLGFYREQPGKQTRQVKQSEDDPRTMYESVSTRPDTKDVALCNVCGSAKDLKRCSACKAVHYCSGTCQKQDWPKHKAVCKNLAAERQTYKAQVTK